MSDDSEKGYALFGEIYGSELADGCKSFAESEAGFGSLQAKWTLDFAFGQIWTREEQLPRKLRSFAVLGMLIGLRQPEEIKMHVRMGVANGLTRQDFEEIFYTALVYTGFPIANTAKAAMLEAFEEMAAEGKTIP